MVTLALAPNLSNNRQSETDQSELSLEYSRQHLTRTDAGLVATSTEVLTIDNDRSAGYTKIMGENTDEKRFATSNEEMKRLKALILGTGFIHITKTDYPQREGLANLTKYTLKVRTSGDMITISWVDPDSLNGTVPPIITNTASQLDAIISSRI
jgi:hypothetical protein